MYDFLKETLDFFDENSFPDNEELISFVNAILEQELSGYRFINGVFTDITDKQEIEMLENALADEDFPNVRAHLQKGVGTFK